MAIVWRLMFDRDLGLLNYLLGFVGVERVPWLMTPRTAMPAVIIMSVWQGIGFPTLLWLAGLQGVPQSYYDAAEVDGAGRWAIFRYVTWPFLTPTGFFMLILACINSFQVFQQTFILTQGGPRRSTYTLVYQIYDKAFRNFEMGYACALAYVLFAFVLVLTFFQFRLQGRWVNYEIA
jgi:ABC-type sugar transport system permease subunit